LLNGFSIFFDECPVFLFEFYIFKSTTAVFAHDLL
jgi:hypothetical protein